MDIQIYVSGQVFGYIIVFSRIGSALIFLPGFGEAQIPMRARLLLALVVSLVLYSLTPVQAMQIDTPIIMLGLLGPEITTGLWIGLTARILLSAIEFTGNQIGQVSGLSNAFGPTLGTFQGATMIATFLLLSSVALIFVTDMHHIVLIALLDSYSIFHVGEWLPGAMAQQMVKATSRSLYIGTSIAAPFIVTGIILNLGLGLANRMMPQLPVFFVAASGLIASGLIILWVAAPYMTSFFLDQFQSWLGSFQF